MTQSKELVPGADEIVIPALVVWKPGQVREAFCGSP
jgi:hypothetical protein